MAFGGALESLPGESASTRSSWSRVAAGTISARARRSPMRSRALTGAGPVAGALPGAPPSGVGSCLIPSNMCTTLWRSPDTISAPQWNGG
ncbi:hypothetical protein ACFFX0_00540 [Citricoccus parietis]|uniref:Uncharacterized protein n=1 Tax=Citricoccus parietis TaxID=592307 RepID=A0ABV5FSU6_9MICC